MNLNKAFIIGNLTRDPETRSLPSGQTVVTFGVATNRRWTDPQGQRQEQTEFHNIVAFGKLAELCGQYLAKGRSTMIEGRLQTRSWQAQDGTKRNRTEIVADNIQFGPRTGGFSSPRSDDRVGAGNNEKETPRATIASAHPQQDNPPSIQYSDDSEPINPDEMPF